MNREDEEKVVNDMSAAFALRMSEKAIENGETEDEDEDEEYDEEEEDEDEMDSSEDDDE